MREEILGEDGLLWCKVCGERRERIIDFPLLDGTGSTEKRKVNCNCRCDREQKEATEKRFAFEEAQRQISELRKLSLMDAKLTGVTFGTYRVTEDNRKAFDIAKRYVGKFDEMYQKGQGILFWGDVGTGKSYTAAAIANELLNGQTSVVMTSFIKLLGVLRSFEKEDSDYIDRLNRAKLLVIDDFGAESASGFTLEKVYDIIDSRYRTGKPIIITTNMRLPDMQSCEDIRYNRIYDRLFEMCYPVKMDGKSWRKREAAARFDTMKKILEG